MRFFEVPSCRGKQSRLQKEQVFGTIPVNQNINIDKTLGLWQFFRSSSFKSMTPEKVEFRLRLVFHLTFVQQMLNSSQELSLTKIKFSGQARQAVSLCVHPF